jgi:DNA-binding XRE family transcriptional regulator
MRRQRNEHATTRNGSAAPRDDLLALDGQTLKELRKRKRLTQQTAAEEVGIHVRQLQNLEAEKTATQLETAEALASFYEVQVDTIVKGHSLPESAQIPPYFRGLGIRSRLAAAFEEEVRNSLQRSEIYSASNFGIFFQNLLHNRSFHKVLGKNRHQLQHLSYPVRLSDRYGLNRTAHDQLKNRLTDMGGGTIAVPATLLTALVVLRYLADVEHIPISVDCCFALGSELLTSLNNSNSIGCVLPAGSTASLLSQFPKDFVPVMVWPGGTQELLCHPQAVNSFGTIGLVSNRPSSSLMFLDDQVDTCKLDVSSLSKVHMEPEEMVRAVSMDSTEIALCQWFPQNLFSRLFGGWVSPCERVESAAGGSAFMFLSRSLAENRDFRLCMDICTRNAILALLEDQNLCSSLIGSVVDATHLTLLGRISGLHHFNRRH